MAGMSQARESTSADRLWAGFSRYAWAVLAYTLVVILFGSWVRITGSGAGCGDHWPTCHGELIPRSPQVKTVIEYTHRITSGILGPGALGLAIWAWFGAGRRRVTRVLAVSTFVLVGVEAAIGAGLVLKELVADDDSGLRAFAVALHLGNTLLLTGAAALTAWFGAGRRWPGLRQPFRHRGLVAAGIVCVVLVSMTGAITALGDTLFPVPPSTEPGWLAHVRDDLSPGAHFLVQLRVIHPVFAVFVGAALLWLCGRFEVGVSRRLALLLKVFLWAQLVFGSLNIALGAPGWLQLLHLLMAQAVWMCVLLLFFAESERARART